MFSTNLFPRTTLHITTKAQQTMFSQQNVQRCGWWTHSPHNHPFTMFLGDGGVGNGRCWLFRKTQCMHHVKAFSAPGQRLGLRPIFSSSAGAAFLVHFGHWIALQGGNPTWRVAFVAFMAIMKIIYWYDILFATSPSSEECEVRGRGYCFYPDDCNSQTGHEILSYWNPFRLLFSLRGRRCVPRYPEICTSRSTKYCACHEKTQKHLYNIYIYIYKLNPNPFFRVGQPTHLKLIQTPSQHTSRRCHKDLHVILSVWWIFQPLLLDQHGTWTCNVFF